MSQIQDDSLDYCDPNDPRWSELLENVSKPIEDSGTQTEYFTKNFSYPELIKSNTAVRYGINNVPSKEIKENLRISCVNLWQPVRDFLNKPMQVNSGYRSPELNIKVGGSKTSVHCYGSAIDFIAPGYGNTRKIANDVLEFLLKNKIPFDQIILEFPNSPGSWIHLGYKHPTKGHRRQVLTAVKDKNGRTVYLKGLH